jgi:ribosomal protein S18 acetylase RimI-like enzyme
VRELRGRLALDSGYFSRLLRSLERQGLVAVEPSVRDRRVRRVRLTAAGREERAELERRSDALARSLLEPLSESQRTRLTAAMAEVERLLLASMVTVEVEAPTTPDARWCFAQYYDELDRRFDTGFDPGRSISADAPELTSPAGLLVIVRLRGQPVGCGALKLHPHPDAWAELKRMWISPHVRGLGLGRRLLEELEAHAAAAGTRTIRLETNATLGEAIALYRRSGYEEVPAFNDEPYAQHWFEKRIGS